MTLKTTKTKRDILLCWTCAIVMRLVWGGKEKPILPIADFHQRRKYPCLSRVFENSALFSHLQKTTCLLPYSNVLSRSFPNRICMRNLVQYIVVVLHLGPRSTWDVSSSGHTTLQNSLVQFSSLSEGALKKKKLKAKERAFFFTEAPEYSSWHENN